MKLWMTPEGRYFSERGETGRKERGALGSLCKKGVLRKTDFNGEDDDYIVVGDDFTKRELADIVGWKI